VAATLLVASPTLTLWIYTWADSVCIHQLVLKPHSKAACITYKGQSQAVSEAFTQKIV